MKKIYSLFIAILIFISVGYSQCGDCPAQCVSADFTATACDGTIDEIGGTNQGCQSANEATSSYWYSICFTSNGTFAFTMNPDGNRNDFDFAVYTGTTCPPTTAPVRCSFAAEANGDPCEICDYTGMATTNQYGNTVSDTSEDVGGDGYVTPLSVSNGSCITLVVHNYGAGSDAFVMDFTGTAGMTCVGVPLGVGFESISGVAKEAFNQLTWSVDNTATQNDRFVVLKSSDMSEWQKIGYVDANSSTTYKFNDYDTNEDVSYYKIESVDQNNNHYITKSVVVSRANKVKITSTKVYDVFGKQHSLNNLPSGMIIIITEYEDGSVESVKEFN